MSKKLIEKDGIETEPRQGQPVKSAKRVMEIFELFDQERRPLSQTEVSQILEYPVASTAALLKSLLALDYLSYDRLSRTYSPTIRVAMLGDWIRADVLRGGKVVAAMKTLAEKLGETIYLGMQNDLYAQYVHTEQSGRVLKYFLSPGTIRPLARSAAGIMLLASLTDPQINRLLSRIARNETTLDQAEVLERIEQARKDGFAYNEGYSEGIGAVALPLPFKAHGRPLVLCLGGPTAQVKSRLTEIVGTMRKTIAAELI